jgi:hypothetical protein
MEVAVAYTTPEAKIALALQDRLKAHVTAWETLVSFTGTDFNTPATGNWFEERIFWNTPKSLGLADASQVQHRGLYQITIVWPKGTGLAAQQEVAGLLIAHFAKGTVMTESGVTVRVEKNPWPLSPLQDGSWVKVPVTIPWRSIV